MNKTLFQLVRSSDLDGLKILLSTNEEINLQLNEENPKTHLTPLMVACNRPISNLDVISLLIEKGALVDFQRGSRSTAFLLAIEQGNVEAAKCLIKHNAKVDLKDSWGESALEIGCKKGNIEVVKFLINDKLFDRKSISHCLFISTSTAIVQLLLDGGADTNILDKDDKTPLMSINYTNIDIAKMLIDYGANIDHQDDCGRSTLMNAIENGYIELAELLLEKGANATTSWSDVTGESAASILVSVT